ncbi:hypothetical protein IWQ57_002933 [Coemansia nantahalensis]|uniref:Uncharacterized protein n=1 Tax=Coemansia nantahalensis TaxID=2789366 RepID=A0ACC1JY88_9FUNG|nr:hypothetical protein IWQ57_002933 [Coemansia nantahalensis]
MNDFAAVLALSLLSSCLAEAISYALVYRTPQFRELKAKVAQCELRLEEEKQVTAARGKNRQRRIESIEAQLSAARSKAGSLQMRSMLVVGAVQIGAIYVVNSWFSGRAVAMLPFEPLAMFRGLTHRGLADDSPANACSATFVFVLGGLAFKASIDRWLQLGLPKGNSLPAWVARPEEVFAGKR